MNGRSGTIRWLLCGLVLAGLHAFIAFLSFDFAYGTPLSGRPIVVFVCLELLAGGLYLIAVWGSWKRHPGGRLLIWVLVCGAVMRLALFFSAPILESDFYRYLWDGGVTAIGQNPYALAPADIAARPDQGPPEIRHLAAQSGAVLNRINYPHLRTIYPPVAQAAFAVAHWLGPWRLWSWRLVLLFCELAAVAVLAALLWETGQSMAALAIYWWNPLVVKEVVNSAHMDVLILPFLLGALLLVTRRKHILAAVLLAAAVGTKFWPLVLAPILFRDLIERPRRFAAVLGTCVVLTSAILLPYAMAATGNQSGLVAYSGQWEMNDPFFMLFLWLFRFLSQILGTGADTARWATRLVVGFVFCGWIGWLARRPAQSTTDLIEKCLLATGALFLLSPTQFPWYALWFIPFLTVRPRLSLVLLTVLLPLYYLRFHFLGIGRPEMFDYGVVFVEFIPVWFLLGWEAWTGRTSVVSEPQR
jgi:hypothetical protein